jgi:Tfp pilus assembly protein PilF
MGERYLERTARWRTQRPRHTDKMPDNWLLAGAALAMLPGARVIDCRREPIETAWSCYKQWFGNGRQLATYDLTDITAQMRDHERLMRFWQQRFPGCIREQSYEKLVADPDDEVRALLDFCGLAFDPACLRFNESNRHVRSASSAQVRQPLRSDTARADRYGALLAPLRRLLEEDASPTPALVDAVQAASAENASIPPADRGALLAKRLAGLPPSHQIGLAHAIEALAHQRIGSAHAAIEAAFAAHPEHAEALHLMAALEGERGHPAEAIALAQRALGQRAGDATLLDTLGRLQVEAGQLGPARQSFELALESDPRAAGARYKLAGLLMHAGDRAGARALLQQAISDAPTFIAARTGLAELLEQDGDPVAAAQAYRGALQADSASCAAWSGLVRVCAGALSASEAQALADAADRVDRAPVERARMGIALATVLESRGRCREAFATLVAANALMRRTLEWNESRFSGHCARIAHAFTTPIAQATEAHLGADIVFLVGAPESGAAEMEAVLAAHPRVAAGGESPDLAAVVADESRRRGRAFPDWVAEADATDWQRLGEDYLQRARARHPAHDRVIDRTRALGTLLGAAAAMLPGARFIECARDPLDACWVLFREDHEERPYGYDLIELAAYWRAHAQLMALWRTRLGADLHRHDPDQHARDDDDASRALLAAAGIDFDPACADAYAHRRALLATLDAREAGLRHAFRASDYGDLLAPLQRAIDAASTQAHVPA